MPTAHRVALAGNRGSSMTDVSFLPVAAAILGAVAGGGIGFFTARYTALRTARAAAASNLRAAFIPELVAMKFDRGSDKFDADRLLSCSLSRGRALFSVPRRRMLQPVGCAGQETGPEDAG